MKRTYRHECLRHQDPGLLSSSDFPVWLFLLGLLLCPFKCSHAAVPCPHLRPNILPLPPASPPALAHGHPHLGALFSGHCTHQSEAPSQSLLFPWTSANPQKPWTKEWQGLECQFHSGVWGGIFQRSPAGVCL